jgi:hypothetical protein
VVGKQGEAEISEYFRSIGYKITPATLYQQLHENWDIKIEKDGEVNFIEVKTEPTAERTNNVFWEMQVGDKPGWTQKYTSNSLEVIIIWFLPVSKVFYAMSSKRLELISKIVENAFPIRTIQNKGFSAFGHLVPLSFLKTKTKQFNIESNHAENSEPN